MPTKDSLPSTMPPGLVEVSHANGVSRFTKNKLAALLMSGSPEDFGMHPIVPTRHGKAPYPFPGVKSALSEEYGFVVRDAQRSVALSSGEMRRYLLGKLSRDEQEAVQKAETPEFGLRIEIAHEDDVEIMDPNGAAVLFLSGDCFSRNFEPIKLREDGDETLQSAISGEPALVYRAGGLDIPLTLEEMQRLVAHALAPEDWARLQVIYGDFYEIGPHFYDPATGEALQPALEEDELGPRRGGPRI